MRDIVEIFKSARQVNTPTLAIETPDQPALETRLFAAVANGAPRIHWDCVSGLVGINEEGSAAVSQLGDGVMNSSISSVAFGLIKAVAPKSLIVAHNAHLFFGDPMTIQALANLRDLFTQNKRTLVLLAPSFRLGSELSDIVLLEEARPSDEERANIIDKLLKSAYDGKVERLPEWLDATRGLSAFLTEQEFAMSMEPKGVDTSALWERKSTAVNQTPGLKFVRGSHPNFEEDLGGLDAIHGFFKAMMKGPKKPGVIVFLDEAEKAFAGSSSDRGDSTGVSQDLLLSMLTWMENRGHDGMIAVGMPGTGKTAAGMAIGPTFGIPTVVLDTGALKGSHVGESERAVREALKIIDSIAGDGGAYVFATCNSESSLPPELKRRFKDCRWFFDLPTEEEKKAIWPIHLGNRGFGDEMKLRDGGDFPDDTNWTGSEIRNCCDLAWRLGLKLTEASRYIVPIATSDPGVVDKLRASAKGRWLSASTGFTYRTPDRVGEPVGRTVKLDG